MKTPSPGLSIFEINPGRPAPVSSALASSATLQNVTGLFSRGWKWIRERQAARSNASRLHVASTVSLGEKRIVAVIQVDGLQFLVGGGQTNVTLLAQLNTKDSFGNVLQETITFPSKQHAKRTKKKTSKPKIEQMRQQA